MRKLLSAGVGLTLLGSYVQIIILYFLDYVYLIQYGDRPEQIVAVFVLAMPTIGFIAFHRFIMKIVNGIFNKIAEF